MEVDNHTIIIGPLPYIWKFINKIHISIFWHQKIVSSAYLNNKFMSEMQQRSLAITIHKVGPIPDPYIILRVMGCIAENRPSVVLHTWTRSVKNAIIQFKTEDGKSRALSLDNIMVCFTISKALEKSINKKRTYELFYSINVARCIKCTNALVVLPVGRKPNWSANIYAVIASLKHCRTTIFSAIQDKMGVTDIGQ